MRSLRQGQRKSHRTVDQQCQVLDVEKQIRVRARRACKKQIRKTMYYRGDGRGRWTYHSRRSGRTRFPRDASWCVVIRPVPPLNVTTVKKHTMKLGTDRVRGRGGGKPSGDARASSNNASVNVTG